MRANEFAVFLFLSAASLTLIVFLFWDSWAPDLSAIYFASRAYGLGDFQTLYQSPPLFFGGNASEAWVTMAEALGYPDEPVLPYAYAPIWAALLSVPATHINPIMFFNYALLINGLLISGCVILVARLLKFEGQNLRVFGLLSFGAMLFTTPFFTAFWLNQPHILLTFLVLFGFERLANGSNISAGVLLGIATALKIFPAVFILLFLARKRWLAAGVFFASAVTALLVSILVSGFQLHLSFIEQLSRVGASTILTPLNFSLDAWFIRARDFWIEGSFQSTNGQSFYMTESVRAVGLVTSSVLLLVLAFIVVSEVRAQTSDAGLGTGLLFVWAATTLLSPLAWSHYLLGPIILGLGLAVSSKSVVARILIACVLILLSHPMQRYVTVRTLDPFWLMSVGVIAIGLLVALAIHLRSKSASSFG